MLADAYTIRESCSRPAVLYMSMRCLTEVCRQVQTECPFGGEYIRGSAQKTLQKRHKTPRFRIPPSDPPNEGFDALIGRRDVTRPGQA